ncbi:MAG: aminoglycoside phosphotransferase family protein [Planctomycetes bacterium]|nr:aminoglycoside phosphotransferase family protein [Planctomycetota bacterium]MBI3845868.1 aminoglycoside phosphotransferase family protein [Planctomycetota bacterium]
MNPAPLAIVRGLGRAYPFLKMPTRHGVTGRWVFLVFRHGERDPSWVVKGTRDPRGIAALRAERDALRRLATAIEHSTLASQVPRLLGWDETESEACLVETFLAGIPLAGRFASTNESGLADALDWLARFHEAARLRIAPISRDAVESALTACESLIPDDATRQCVEREIRSLQGRPAPHGFVHGDFNPHNVLREGNALSVIDWEDSHVDGLVSDDVFDFTAVAEFIGRPVAREVASATLRRLGVPEEIERALRLQFLVRALGREAARDSSAATSETSEYRERWVRVVRREIEVEGRRIQVG